MPARDCDKTLKRCFGSGNKAEEKIVLGNLEQEIQIIQRDTKNILVDFS